MESSILDQFDLPQVAVDSIRAQKLKMNNTGDGIQHLSTEHTGGLPFRFVNHAEYLTEKSKRARFETFQEIELIEWTVDSKNRYVERIHHLPREVLEFEIIGYREATPNTNPNFQDDPFAHPVFGECIGGMLKPAYDRFKEGKTAPGLALTKWDVISDSDTASLSRYGVFTVEQFAAMPRAKIMNGQTPASLQEAFERAIFYVNGKENRIKEKDLADKLMAMAQEASKKDALLESMQEQMRDMKEMFSNRPAQETKVKRKPGRKPKLKTQIISEGEN